MKKLLLLLLVFSSVGLAAQVTVQGTITVADNGGPAVGATVILKGTTEGAVADADGRYSITVDNPDATLVYSYLGYVTQEISLGGGRRLIDVILEVDSHMLEETVVMGYSTKSKNEITSAVTTLQADDINDFTSHDIGNMLQGKVAGLSVIRGSGSPGASPSIRVRGVSSMNAPSEPLYVVDGIIGGEYDPNDVETITVLKDAGATGMYGAQANGGVIVITTKRATSEKIQFNFKAGFGLTTADFSRQDRMNSAQLYQYYREYFRDPETFLVDDVAFNKAIPRSVLDTDTDWRDEVFDPGFVQNYHISMRGKSKNHSFYNGVSYYDEKGVLRTTGFRRLNVRSNNTFTPAKWLTITSNLSLTARDRDEMDTTIMYYVEQALPWDNPRDENGNLRKFQGAPGIWMRDPINPLLAFEGDNFKSNSKSFGLHWDLVLNAQITPWLSFTTQNRVSGRTNKSHYHRTTDMEHMQGGDAIEESQTFNYGFITTNMLQAKKDFGRHSIGGLVGYEAQMDYGEDLSGSAKGLPFGLYVLDVAAGNYGVGGSKWRTGMQSVIAQANYNYAMKYFLSASFRMDQSSTFNAHNRTAYFPSVSASWVIKNEPWMEDVKAISELKLRASWGITGMKDIGASKYLDSFSYSAKYDGQSAAIPSQMANPDLKWEQTMQNNIGLEIGLFNRLNVDLNWYYNMTDNLLVYRDLPPSGGFSSQWQNMGGVVNTGFEMAINTTPVLTKNFRWDVDFSLSYNKNWLYGFGKGNQILKSTFEGIQQVYEDGEQLYTWYLKEYAGVDKETGRPMYIDADGNETPNYGDARYVKAGSPLSPWQGGISTSLTWKNWTLSAAGTFVWGNILYGQRRASNLPTFVENSLLPSSFDKIWQKPGDIANISLPYYSKAHQYHTGDLVRGDFFKLHNVSLSYTLPKKIMKDKGLTFTVSCDNLFTLTNVWGGDPETSIDGDMPGRINDLENRYPNTRQYVFQINFTF